MGPEWAASARHFWLLPALEPPAGGPQPQRPTDQLGKLEHASNANSW